MDTVIKISPELPCCTVNGDSYCMKPASVGIVWWNNGMFFLQAICADCTAATTKLYKVASLDDSLLPEKESSNATA